MATRTISNAGGNWSAAGTWVEGVAPTNADDVVATATSGSITIDTTTCVAKSVDFTNYPGTSTVTFTASKVLTISGNFKMIAGMNITGTGTLVHNGTASTLTSGGVTFPGALTLNWGGNVTIGSNWSVTGLVTCGTNGLNLLGNQITCNGGLAVNASTTGTTLFILGGGTWSGSNTTGIANNLTIAGNVTISGNVYYKTGTLTYASGTVTVTGSTLNITMSCTLNTGGMTWNYLYIQNGGTITLGSSLNVNGTLRMLQGTICSGAFNINCSRLEITTGTITFASGTTITVTTSLALGYLYTTLIPITIKSSVAAVPAYFIYQGTHANSVIAGTNFTDIDASGSAIKLYNYQGGTLTRTVNIENIVLPPAKFNPINGCSFIKGVK